MPSQRARPTILHPILLTLLCSTWLACSSYLSRGMNAIEADDWLAAEAAATDGLAVTPEDPHLLLILAQTRLALGDPERAAAHAEQALRTGELNREDQARAHLTAAQAHQLLANPVERAQHLVAANTLQATPNDLELRTLITQAASLAGAERRHALAFELWLVLHRLNIEAGLPEDNQPLHPSLLQACQEHALLLIAQADQVGTLNAVVELTRCCPEDFESWLLAGLIHLRLGQTEPAREAFEQAMQVPSTRSAAERLHEFARVAASSRHWALAIAYDQQALSLDPELIEAYLQLARVHALRDEPDQAEAVLGQLMEAAFTHSPESQFFVQAVLQTYQTALSTGLSESGLSWLEEANRRIPSIEIARTLAEAYLRRDQAGRAEEVLREVISRAEDPSQMAEAVGDWYHDRDLLEAAAAYYREAISAAPQATQLHLKLASVFADLGWSHQVSNSIAAFLAGPAERLEKLRAVEILEQSQLWPEAAQTLEQLYREHPEDREVAWRLGNALFLAGEPERELQLYRDLLETSREETGPTLLQVAQVFIDRGDHRQAVYWLEEATAHPEQRARALLELAYAHQLLDQTASMWESYDSYIAESADPVSAAELVLERFRAQAFAPLAAALLERILELDPTRQDLRLELATRRLSFGPPALAVEAFVDYVTNSTEGETAVQTSLWALTRRQRQDLVQPLMDALRQPSLSRGPLSIESALARHYLDLARSASAAGDLARHRAYLAAARSAFREWTSLEEVSSELLVSNAGRMLNAGFHDLAADTFQRLLERGYPIERVRRQYALALINSGSTPDYPVQLLREELAVSREPVLDATSFASQLAAQGHLEQALGMLDQAQSEARSDEELLQTYRLGANLLLQDGRHDELVLWANRLVELSRNSTEALHYSAQPIIEAGLYQDARQRLELALRLAPQQSGIVEDLARIDILTGNLVAGFSRFERLTRSFDDPSRMWFRYALLFESSGHYRPAREALLRAQQAGGESAALLVELGRLEALLGNLEKALTDFDHALDLLDRSPQTLSQRHQLFDRILTTLEHLGQTTHLDRYLRRALDDPNLRPSYLPEAARLAFARGNTRLGQQLLRAYIDEGGDLQEIISLELTHGFYEQAAARLTQLINLASLSEATALLELHIELLAQNMGTDTIQPWIETLERRGGSTHRAWLNLAEALAYQGRNLEAAEILRSLATPEQPFTYEISALEILTAAPQEISWLEHTWSNLASSQSLPSERLRELVALSAVFHGGDNLTSLLSGLADTTSSSNSRLAQLEWLMAHGRTQRALEQLELLLTPLRAGGFEPPPDLPDHASILAMLDLVVDYGYFAECSSLLSRLTEFESEPSPALLLAIRCAHLAGETTRARELTQRYLELSAHHTPTILMLSEALADLGATQEALSLLTPIITQGTERDSRQAVQIATRAAFLGNQPQLAFGAIDTILERRGVRYQLLMQSAEHYERLNEFSQAATLYLQALYLLPGEPLPLLRAARNLALEGSFDQLSGLLSQLHNLPEHRQQLFDTLEHHLCPETDSAFLLTLHEQALRIDTASLSRRAAAMNAALLQGEIERANQLLSDIQQTPEDPLNSRIILHALRTNSHIMAVELAHRAVEQGAPSTIFLAASLLHQAGETAAAIQALVSFTELHDRTGFTREVLERLSAWQAWPEVEALAQQALERRPESRGPHAYRIAALMHMGEHSLAAGELEDYLARTPHPPPEELFLLSRAQLVDQTREPPEELLLLLSRSIRLRREVGLVLEGLTLVIRAFLDTGRAVAGANFIERHFPYLLLYPNLLDDPSLPMELYRQSEDPASAQALYRHALTLWPHNPHLNLGLARLLAETTEQLEEASLLCNRSLIINDVHRYDLLALKAWIALRQGQENLARDNILKAWRALGPTRHDQGHRTRWYQSLISLLYSQRTI